MPPSAATTAAKMASAAASKKQVKAKKMPNLHLLKQLKSKHPSTLPRQHANPVKWYNCGPTVYSDSHMGHARNYLTIDILRRILERFFGLECYFVQNITDLDDKLINTVYYQREHGNSHQMSDSALMKNIAMKYEESYWKDMDDLNVKRPNHILRVTEHIPAIQEMISKLLSDGYAYVGKDSGSIYFDTRKLKEDNLEYDHFGLCCTEAEDWTGPEERIGVKEKRSLRDFALWKRDTSEFGYSFSGHVRGRPGWHIECSAMSGSVFGSHVDIHSGGIDLQFPHHTNEMAQSRAYHHCEDWVTDWIHIGHLHIEGMKMSKSMKNFTSIQEGLKHYDARTIRMMALLHHYADPVDYSQDLMQHATDMERQFREYFLKTSALLRHTPILVPKPRAACLELRQKFWNTKDEIRGALLNNFDTPRAVQAMAELMRSANRYEQQTARTVDLDSTLLKDIAVYLTDMMRSFGFLDDNAMGFNSQGGLSSGDSNSSGERIMDTFSQFRADVRRLAGAKDLPGIWNVCDTVRNKDLPKLGVRLEDLSDGKSIWKFQDPKEIEKDMKKQEQQQEIRDKHAEAMREKQRAREQMLQVHPQEYFKTAFPNEYSKFDDSGLPTHDIQGEPLSKSRQKKLKKMLSKHEEAFERNQQASSTEQP